MKDRQFVIWQSLEILNIFNTLRPIFSKTKTFFKKLEYRFLLKVIGLKTHFPTKLPCQKPTLRWIKWRVQDEPIRKNGGLLLSALFFWKYCYCLINSYKELIWCTNYINVHIHTFEEAGVLYKGSFLLWVSSKEEAAVLHYLLIQLIT